MAIDDSTRIPRESIVLTIECAEGEGDVNFQLKYAKLNSLISYFNGYRFPRSNRAKLCS